MFMDTSDTACMLCAEEMGDTLLPAFGECNHRGVCSICFTRMRALLRDFSCPICKKDLDKVVCSSTVQRYEELSIWGTDAGAMFFFDERAKMFFPRKYHREKVAPLWVSKCSVCDTVKRDSSELRKHVQSAHNMMMCQLCIDNLQSFPSEFKIYSMKEYESHLRTADKAGSQGHPSCEFCRKRYFDKNALFMHLHVDHFTCHICEKEGIKFKYYQNYKSLESHFRRDHCICEEPSCLQKRFIVFSSEIELTSHRMTWHPSLQLSRNIPVTFRSYRERQESKPSATDDSDRPQSDGSERRRRIGEFDGGIAGLASNGEWQLELQNPVAGANRTRSAGATAQPTAAPVAVAAAAPSSRLDPHWPGGPAGGGGSKNDFPGLSESNGRKPQGAMLGNWGKAAARQSANPQVMKPKNKAAPANPVHPKDMKIVPAKPAAATPAHPINSAIAAAIQSSSTPMFEPKKEATAADASVSKLQKTSNASKGIEKMSLNEPDYPPLSGAGPPVAASSSTGTLSLKVSNKTNINAEDYPSLPKPPPPQKSASLQDKMAYPPLPPSASGTSKKSAPPKGVDAPYGTSARSAAGGAMSSADLIAGVGAGFVEPIQTKKTTAAFSNTINDELEYPSLPQKKKKGIRAEKAPATVDDSAAAFRSIRASVLGTKPTPQSPPKVAGGSSATPTAAEHVSKPSMSEVSAEDYPPLFSSFRIGVPFSTNSSGGKTQQGGGGKSASKKQQKADLRKLAFNMK